MTVIYNMSIDRADKPWIGDRRFTEGPGRQWLDQHAQRVPVGEICKTSGSWMAKSRSWGEIPDPQDLKFMGTWGTGR